MSMNERVLLAKLLRLIRLLGPSARLFVEGLEKALEDGDVSALYHYSTMIKRNMYLEKPRPPWPGFFKHCRGKHYELPEPLRASNMDALEAIRRRRSRRSYSSSPLSLEEVATLLYHGVGITGWDNEWPLRSYPCAGGLQPVEAYLVAGNVEDLPPGLYHYEPDTHRLCLMRQGHYLGELAKICLDQEHVAEAPAAIILTAMYQRTASKYHARAYRYIHVDTGAVVENIYIAAEALGLATVVIGAFYDQELCTLLGIDCYTEIPVAVMPIGHRVEI